MRVILRLKSSYWPYVNNIVKKIFTCNESNDLNISYSNTNTSSGLEIILKNSDGPNNIYNTLFAVKEQVSQFG